MPRLDRAGRFATTQWSLVIAAGDPNAPATRDALAKLFETYWPAVFAYLRRHGAAHEAALDLTQGFFATVLEKNYLGDARRERGRFRTFLLTSLGHYVANERDRASAQRRGGGGPSISLDGVDLEHRRRLEPSHDETPERAFERQWARSLLDLTLERLREEAALRDDPTRGDRLVRCLFDEPKGYALLAEELGISEGAARVALHRLRARFRALLREEVARTIESAGDIDDELRHLRGLLQP